MTSHYLYKITNKINGKLYIGVSKNPYKRFKGHQSKRSNCTKLKNAIDKYGSDSFVVEVLCEGSLEYISELEGKAIELYNSRVNGYNILYGHHKKNLKTPPEVGNKISSSLYKHYEENTSKNLGRKYDKCYNDHPVYVLGFWFPSVRFCSSVFNKHHGWVMQREGSDQAYIKPPRAKRKDDKFKDPLYVGGFWWPDIDTACINLKMTKSKIKSRVRGGNVEAFSTAMRESKIGKRNPMSGRTGALNSRSKPVLIDGVIFESITEASHSTIYTKKQIYSRLKNDKYTNFSYL